MIAGGTARSAATCRPLGWISVCILKASEDSFVQAAGCRIRTGLQICWALRLKPSAYQNSPQNSASEFVESKFSHIFHLSDPRLQMLVERGRGQVAKLVLDFMRGNGIEVSTTHCNTLISAFQDAFGNVLEGGMKKLRSNYYSDLIDPPVTMTLQRLQLLPMMQVPGTSIMNLDEYLDL